MTDQEFVHLTCTLFGWAFDVTMSPQEQKKVELEVLRGRGPGRGLPSIAQDGHAESERRIGCRP